MFNIGMCVLVGMFAISSVCSAAPKVRPMVRIAAADFGNVPLGEFAELDLEVIPFGSPWTSALTSASIVGSTDFQVISDTCQPTFSSICHIKVRFTPTAVGYQAVNLSFTGWDCPPGSTYPGGRGCHTTTGLPYLYGRSIEEPPKKECRECGSIIRVDQQALIESIPVVGTELDLVYSSAYSQSYVSNTNTLGTKNVFNPHRLTVSAHHFYDVNQTRLYRGDGVSEQTSYITLGSGNLRVVSTDGAEVYEFGPNGRHLNTRYAKTGTTKYTFNYSTGNRLTSIVDAFGNTTTFNQNGSDQLTSIVAPFGQTTTVGLTGGVITSITNPNSEVYSLTYKTGTDLLETFTKPGNQVSTFTYDTNGRLTKDQAHGGNYFTLSQNTSLPKKPITVTSKLGRAKVVEVEKTTNGSYVRTETEPDGVIKTYTENRILKKIIEDNFWYRITSDSAADERLGSLYDRPSASTLRINGVDSVTTYSRSVAYPGGATPGLFNFSTITDTRTKAGASHTSVYTASTGETLTTSAEGATTLTTTDTYERPTAFKVGNDTAWSLTYDTNGRLSEVKQGTNQHRQTFAYNTNGYVSSVTNALNEQTSYTYDLSGRVTQITLPDTRVIGISYDANGNVTGITPPSRPQHGFVFNAMELLGTYQPPSIGVGITKDTTYTYNDDKQLTQISRPDGPTVDFTYDSTTGNLTTITTPDGTYNLNYGSTNKLLNRKRAPSGIRNEFTYYGPLMESDSQVRASDSFLFGRVTFGFDSHHRVSSRTIRGNAATPTSTINYTYDDDEKPTQVGDLALTYTYPSGRLSGTTLNNVADAYTYDSYGRLASYTATYTPTSTVLYTYTLTRDDVGRITQKVETIGGVTDTYEYTYDSAGRLSTVEKNNVVTDSFMYDSNSNRTSGTINSVAFTATYDDQDRILTFNSQTYTHNRNGDLTKIQWNLTDATDFVYDVMGNLKQATIPGGTVLDYTNDGMDRRIVKRSNSTFQWRYIYENQLRVAAVLNGTHAYGREFVYATKVNVPDYMIFNGNKFRIITDHLGSPRLAVRSDTGAISQRMDYTVLGHVTNDTNPGFQPFGFAGGIYDAQIGLVRFGARDYDPRIGRWTTKDPIGFRGGDVNLYGYVLSDPMNSVDPSGLVHPAVATGAVGAVVGFFSAFKNSNAKTKCGFAADLLIGTLSGAAAGALAAVGAGGTSIAGAAAGAGGGLGAGAGFAAIDLFGPGGDELCGCR